MHKRYWILFSLLIGYCTFSHSVFAQPYSISLEIPDAADSSVYLAHYFDGKIYVDDTTHLNTQGFGAFQGDSLLPQGLYVIYLDKDHYRDFLLGQNQQMKITHRFSEPDKFSVQGAIDSELFNQYIAFLGNMKNRQQILLEKKKEQENNPDSIQAINDQLASLDKQIENYWLSEAKKYPDLFYGKFILANYIPLLKPEDIPEQWNKNDSLRWLYQYHYKVQHYWDYLDVSDERFLRTPMLRKRLENYFDNVLIPRADSITPYAFRVIEKARPNPTMFHYVTNLLLDHFIQSSVMGMETVFVRMAEKYYLNGKSWLDSSAVASIGRQVVFKRNNLLGMKAKELKMESMEGPSFSLYEVNTDYTVLAFWEPECGHCKKQIPELYNDVFIPLKDKNITFFAICTQDKRQEWENFVTDHQLYDWVNLWDPNDLNNFRINYDLQTTPMIYILDKDKKILAKKVDPENAKKLLEYLLAGNKL